VAFESGQFISRLLATPLFHGRLATVVSFLYDNK